MAKTDYHIFVENGKVGLKDATDRVVLFAVYDGIVFTGTDTPICVCKDGKWGLTDVNGRTIADTKYDNLSGTCNGRILAGKDDRGGFLDYDGKEVIPLIYENVQAFTDAEYCFGTPCALVQKDGKWGTINTNGEVIIPFEYDNAEDKNGKVLVVKDGKYGVINHKNEFLIPLGDDAIFFHDYNIVGVFNDSTYYAMNLASMEKIETDYRIETIFLGEYAVVCNNGEATFIKGVRKNVAKNVIDKKLNVLLPEWHEDIIILDNDELLLFDKNKCRLYNMASGNSAECQYDEDYVYLPDGKTMFCRNQLNETLCVKAGIENMAWFAHDEGDVATIAKLYQLKTVKFKEGVTTIGTGWDILGAQPSTYTPQVDIYLPSTLTKVNPEAFSKMITSIHYVYVPFGMGDTMRSILPSHLHPFIKERAKGIGKLLEEPSRLNWTDYGSNPPRLDDFISKHIINKILPANGGCLSFIISELLSIVFFAVLGGITFFGFYWAERTVLPFDFITIKTILAILIVSAISPILIFPFVKNKSKGVKDLFKGYFTAFGNGFLLLYLICGYSVLLFFGANKYIGGSEPQYIDGKVTNITYNSKSDSYSMDVEVPEFNTTYNTSWISRYNEGGICKVEYHKGLFGLYVIDGFD